MRDESVQKITPLLVPAPTVPRAKYEQASSRCRALARELGQQGFHGRRQAHIKLGRIILENRFSKNLVQIAVIF